MAGSQKSGIRWWMWISMILGAAASFVLVTILVRRREAKGGVVPVRRIEIKPKAQPRPVRLRPQVKPESAKPKSAEPKPARPKPAKADDLKVIEGIGPKTADLLQSSGIKTYAQLSAAGVERIKAMLIKGGIRANPATWPEQAKLAAAGKWEALEALQAKLKGGRRA
jgi:predicted flap endonuclease-1-like 5' DNA nuclease